MAIICSRADENMMPTGPKSRPMLLREVAFDVRVQLDDQFESSHGSVRASSASFDCIGSHARAGPRSLAVVRANAVGTAHDAATMAIACLNRSPLGDPVAGDGAMMYSTVLDLVQPLWRAARIDSLEGRHDKAQGRGRVARHAGGHAKPFMSPASQKAI